MRKRIIETYQLQGRRSYQQDRYYYAQKRINNVYTSIIAVADGMGGYSGGDIAAEISINAVIDFWNHSTEYESHDELISSFKNILFKANSEIRNHNKYDPKTKDKGSTLTVALLLNNRLLVSHIGDCRLYLIDQRGIEQVTTDHTTENSSEHSIVRTQISALTQCLDGSETISPEFKILENVNDKVLMICSDGIHGSLKIAEIHKLYIDSRGLLNYPQLLCECALLNDSSDNLTAVCSSTEKTKIEINNLDNSNIALKILTAIFLMTVGFGLYYFFVQNKSISQEISMMNIPAVDSLSIVNTQGEDMPIAPPGKSPLNVPTISDSINTNVDIQLTHSSSQKIVNNTIDTVPKNIQTMTSSDDWVNLNDKDPFTPYSDNPPANLIQGTNVSEVNSLNASKIDSSTQSLNTESSNVESPQSQDNTTMINEEKPVEGIVENATNVSILNEMAPTDSVASKPEHTIDEKALPNKTVSDSTRSLHKQ